MVTLPPPTPLPLVLGDRVLSREEVVDICADYLVRNAIYGGGYPFNPDPAWGGPHENAGFGLLVLLEDPEAIDPDGADEGDDADEGESSPSCYVPVDERDLAAIVAKARDRLRARLGYVPSGMARWMRLSMPSATLDVEVQPAEPGSWRVEVLREEPCEDESVPEADGCLSDAGYPDAEGRWATPADALLAVARWAIETYDDADEDTDPVEAVPEAFRWRPDPTLP